MALFLFFGSMLLCVSQGLPGAASRLRRRANAIAAQGRCDYGAEATPLRRNATCVRLPDGIYNKVKNGQGGILVLIIFANCDKLINFARNYCNNSTVFIR